MYGSFQEMKDEFFFVNNINASNTEEIQIYLDESVKANCEGLMVKILDGLESSYEPSKRSRNWLKVRFAQPSNIFKRKTIDMNLLIKIVEKRLS